MIANSLTSEEVLEITYSFSPALPSLSTSNKEEDWICSIVREDNQDGTGYINFYVSTFGGTLSVYNSDNKRRAMKKVTEETILCSELIEWGDEIFIAQGCQNGDLIISKVNTGAKEVTIFSNVVSADLNGDSITSLALNPINTELLACGTASGQVCMFRINLDADGSQGVPKGRKNLKVSGPHMTMIKSKPLHFSTVS